MRISPEAREKIEAAYAKLSSEGQNVTVRSLQSEAQTRINDVSAWLKEHRAQNTAGAPEVPDLSVHVRAIWESAWAKAADMVTEQLAEEHSKILEDAGRDRDELIEAENALANADRDLAHTRDLLDRETARVDELKADLKEERQRVIEAEGAAKAAETEVARLSARGEALDAEIERLSKALEQALPGGEAGRKGNEE